MFCDIYPQRTPAETHLKTVVIHPRKLTRRGCLFQTMESLVIAEVSGSAQTCETVLCTLEVLRALHFAHDLLDFLAVFFSYRRHISDPQKWLLPQYRNLNSSRSSQSVMSRRLPVSLQVPAGFGSDAQDDSMQRQQLSSLPTTP